MLRGSAKLSWKSRLKWSRVAVSQTFAALVVVAHAHLAAAVGLHDQPPLAVGVVAQSAGSAHPGLAEGGGLMSKGPSAEFRAVSAEMFPVMTRRALTTRRLRYADSSSSGRASASADANRGQPPNAYRVQ